MTESLDPGLATLCLFHNDPDGCCAAAVARRALGLRAVFHPLEIGDPVPWDAIEASPQVVLADYSFSLADMQRVRKNRSFLWIDHHKSSLEALGPVMSDVPGRREDGTAACVLAWETFFPGKPVPRAVRLVGDRDVWRMQFPETRAFCEGLYHEDLDPENDALWRPLLDDDPQRVEALIERGGLLYESRLANIVDVVARYGFETTFEGHRTLAVNHRGNGDMGEHIRRAGYTLAYCYVEVVRAGRLQTEVTLYSDDVDVSEIAVKHGGGGHRGAAGFQFTRTDRPFPPGSEAAPS
jgi:uncharacterized protein